MDFAEVERLLCQVYGRECCLQCFSGSGVLSLGFGEVKMVKSVLCPQEGQLRGEWEIGSFYRSWRVDDGRRVICGSQDAVEDIQLFLSRFKIGSLISIEQDGPFDVVARFSTQIKWRFLGLVSDDDDVFHVFFPRNQCIGFSGEKKWSISESRKLAKGAKGCAKGAKGDSLL